MLVNVTVSFTQSFQFKIEENDDIEKQKEKIREHAGYLMETSQSEPVIIACDNEDLVDI